MQNQSKREITFDTQLSTALKRKQNWNANAMHYEHSPLALNGYILALYCHSKDSNQIVRGSHQFLGLNLCTIKSHLSFLGPHYDNPDSISPEFTPTSNVCEVQRLDSDHLPGICVWRSGGVRCNQFPWQLRSKKARETKEQTEKYWHGTWGEGHGPVFFINIVMKLMS